jgi:GTP-binding protein EngB required for normal cell division
MSAGKSTLINALIGRELLPVANQATTACPVRIEHQPGLKGFAGARHGKNALLERRSRLKPETVDLWNRMSGTFGIALRGPFLMSTRSAARRLTLHDTPGPNNSQNAGHRQALRQILQRIPFHALCYVMDARYPATKDERATLELLREEIMEKPEHKIWFVLNQVDNLDRERGESLAESVNDAAKYLDKLGFSNPFILPTAAKAGLCAKKVLYGHALTDDEKIDLSCELSKLKRTRKFDLARAARIPETLRNNWLGWLDTTAGKPYAHLLAASGIVAVEAILHHG